MSTAENTRTARPKNDDLTVVRVVKETVADGGTADDAAAKLGVEVGSLMNRISKMKREFRENGIPEEIIEKSLPPFPDRQRGGRKKDESYFKALAAQLEGLGGE